MSMYQAPNYADLIPVRNVMGGPAVFRDAPSDTTIRWEGAGDPAGGDVQYVPDAFRRHPAFANMLRRGIFQVVGEEQAQAAFAQQDAQVAGAGLAQQAADSIHRPQNRDLVATACLGPGARQGSSCPNTVALSAAQAKTTPPLCDQHRHLASGFVPVDQPDPQTGAMRTVWVQAQMTAPISEAAYGNTAAPVAPAVVG